MIALWIVALVVSVIGFVSARVWLWASAVNIDSHPPRDVRLWARIFAPDLYPTIEKLWPR